MFYCIACFNWRICNQIVPLSIRTAEYLFDIKLHQICFIFELLLLKCLVYEVYNHVAVSVVHVVVYDELHSFESKTLIAVEWDCFEICTLKHLPLLCRGYDFLHSTNSDRDIVFFQDIILQFLDQDNFSDLESIALSIKCIHILVRSDKRLPISIMWSSITRSQNRNILGI